jgi:hypothetical protein
MQPNKQFIELCQKAISIQKYYQKEIIGKIDWEKDGDEISKELFGLRYALDWGIGDFSKIDKIPDEHFHHIIGCDILIGNGIHGKESMESSVFLPDANWCAEKIKNNIYQTFWHSVVNLWEMAIVINPNAPIDETQAETFQHVDYDTVHLLATEYILSDSKNDLRKLL